MPSEIDLKRRVRLGPYWRDRCYRRGIDMVNGYAADPASRALSSHGADSDCDLQAESKMGEVAFCLAAGIDPETLNWKPCNDPGWDTIYRGVKVDVKTITHWKRYMLWPVNKNKKYLGKGFDILVLVKAKPPNFEIVRWISKAAFYRRKQIATTTPGLMPGTWFMEERQLWSIDLLMEFTAGRASDGW